jgi:hypothetical protein
LQPPVVNEAFIVGVFIGRACKKRRRCRTNDEVCQAIFCSVGTHYYPVLQGLEKRGAKKHTKIPEEMEGEIARCPYTWIPTETWKG